MIIIRITVFSPFHGSAGVGRTGTFIALDWLLRQAETEGGVDVYSSVHSLSESCMNMVQTQVCTDNF